MRVLSYITLILIIITTECRNKTRNSPEALIKAIGSKRFLIELGSNIKKTIISNIINKNEDKLSSSRGGCLAAVANMLRLFSSTQFVDLIINSGKWLNDLGDYDGCLSTKTSRYITLQISGLPIQAALGICGPKECGREEYEILKAPIAGLLEDMLHGPTYQGTAMDNYHITTQNVNFFDPLQLHQQQNQIGSGFIISILFFIIVFILVFIGTLKDFGRRRKVDLLKREWERVQNKWKLDENRRGEREAGSSIMDVDVDMNIPSRGSIFGPLDEDPISINRDESITDDIVMRKVSERESFIEIPKAFETPKESTLDKVYSSISLIKNFNSIAYGRNVIDPNTDVLNGCRVLAIFWVIYGHCFSNVASAPLFNMSSLVQESTKFWFAAEMSATFSVDIFFFLTAFLAVAIIYKQFQRPIPLTKILLIYLHRYLRLLPVYLVAFMLFVWILRIGSQGPIFQGYLFRIQDCYQYWWFNALYFNNFKTLVMDQYTTDYTCMGWTWYLPCDFQFFLLVPWIVWLYRKSNTAANIIVLLLAIGSICAQAALCYKYDLSLNFIRFNEYYFKYYYYFPYTRINPFLVGIIVGFGYAEYRDPNVEAKKHVLKRILLFIKESKITRYLMYLFGVNITFWISFLPYWMINYPESWSNASDGIYLIISRPGFVIGMSLIIIPVLVGKGKPILNVLGFPLVNSLAKLVYPTYMVHDIFIELRQYSLKRAMYLSQFQVFIEASGFTLIGFLVALLVSLFFELPFGNLQRLFLQGKGRPTIKREADTSHDSQKLDKLHTQSFMSNIMDKTTKR